MGTAIVIIIILLVLIAVFVWQLTPGAKATRELEAHMGAIKQKERDTGLKAKANEKRAILYLKKVKKAEKMKGSQLTKDEKLKIATEVDNTEVKVRGFSDYMVSGADDAWRSLVKDRAVKKPKPPKIK